MRLLDEVAIITGASKGIGMEIAKEFVREGAYCVLASRDITKLNSIKNELNSYGKNKTLAIKTDVSCEREVENLVEKTIDTHKKLDILINNAGLTKDSTINDMTLNDWNYVISNNLTGVFLCSKYSLKYMKKMKKGSIVNITSLAAQMGNIGQCNYSSSKAGIIGFTKSISREIAKYNIRVNGISPAFVETEMFNLLPDNIKDNLKKQIPMGRFSKSSEISKTAVYLASEDSSYVTGEIININGGFYS